MPEAYPCVCRTLDCIVSSSLTRSYLRNSTRWNAYRSWSSQSSIAIEHFLVDVTELYCHRCSSENLSSCHDRWYSSIVHNPLTDELYVEFDDASDVSH